MKSLLFGISPLDPLTYAVVPIVLVCGHGISQLFACAAGGGSGLSRRCGRNMQGTAGGYPVLQALIVTI
jgi:hypothetical protein